MDFSFSEEQDAVRDLARQIFSDACGHERLAELERDEAGDGVDRALLASLAEANLLGVAIPEKQGGSDYGLVALLGLLEEAGRFLAPVPLLPTLVMGALPIARYGTDAQRDRWLPGVVSGETILTAALDELGGGDPTRPRRTTARAAGEAWVLDGEKVCVPVAASAARILVPARTEDGGVGLFLVAPDAPGVRLEAALGHAYQRQFRVSFEGVELGPEDRLGGDAATGREMAHCIVQHVKVGVTAIVLGVGEEALRRTAEYTAARKQFGRPIGTFQAVTMRAADAFIDLECIRSTLWQAAWRLEEGLPADREVAAAKWWACLGGHRVVHAAQHLHGGTGADVDYPIHRYFLWAKELELVAGGAGIQLAGIGASLASA
jgi:alkylation response protein AidB-like acyl-CoA dehydrogenase